MTKIDIKHIAKLANFKLTENEEERFGKQLSTILEHIDELSEVNIENIEETSQVTGLINTEREDIVIDSISQVNAVSQTDNTHNGLFKVPVILEEAVE